MSSNDIVWEWRRLIERAKDISRAHVLPCETSPSGDFLLNFVFIISTCAVAADLDFNDHKFSKPSFASSRVLSFNTHLLFHRSNHKNHGPRHGIGCVVATTNIAMVIDHTIKLIFRAAFHEAGTAHVLLEIAERNHDFFHWGGCFLTWLVECLWRLCFIELNNLPFNSTEKLVC